LKTFLSGFAATPWKEGLQWRQNRFQSQDTELPESAPAFYSISQLLEVQSIDGLLIGRFDRSVFAAIVYEWFVHLPAAEKRVVEELRHNVVRRIPLLDEKGHIVEGVDNSFIVI